ncbi:hypothetical protein SteCoe_22575 [Stentor coeruleus]|uniref:Uncharacterized protein n=1 Tax=Stentor coeruleus TaxID=5963 RepID=A0A1R2BMG3_9CILI|nr:hypothetical protein SteCoe_22575 [Stentor coeruleus]
MDFEQIEIQKTQLKAAMKNEFKLIKQGSKVLISVGIVLEILWFIFWLLDYLSIFMFCVPFILFITIGYCGLKPKKTFWGVWLNGSLYLLMFTMCFLLLISVILFVIAIVSIFKECDYNICSSNQNEGSIEFIISSILIVFSSVIATLCWFMLNASDRYKMNYTYFTRISRRYSIRSQVIDNF